MTSSVLEKYYHLGAVRIKAVKLLAERGITHRMSEKGNSSGSRRIC